METLPGRCIIPLRGLSMPWAMHQTHTPPRTGFEDLALSKVLVVAYLLICASLPCGPLHGPLRAKGSMWKATGPLSQPHITPTPPANEPQESYMCTHVDLPCGPLHGPLGTKGSVEMATGQHTKSSQPHTSHGHHQPMSRRSACVLTKACP